MKVVLAERIGFCFGVKRAIDMAEEALKKYAPIYSLGSIIHNEQVVRDLSNKGLKVINGLSGIKKGAVIISSHGLSPDKVNKIKQRGLRIVDTTCPFVANAQGIARSLQRSGYKVIIVGDVKHPEVKALVDFASHKAAVIKDKREAVKLRIKKSDRVGILSQTTQSTANFLEVVKAVEEKKPRELKVVNTICKDAEERQEAARALTDNIDAMIIVGGKNSANTRRLYEVCVSRLKKSYLAQTELDLRKGWFKSISVVGITSGASTPDWVIKRVIQKLALYAKNR